MLSPLPGGTVGGGYGGALAVPAAPLAGHRGRDGGDGSFTSPFATAEGAVDAFSASGVSGGSMLLQRQGAFARRIDGDADYSGGRMTAAAMSRGGSSACWGSSSGGGSGAAGPGSFQGGSGGGGSSFGGGSGVGGGSGGGGRRGSGSQEGGGVRNLGGEALVATVWQARPTASDTASVRQARPPTQDAVAALAPACRAPPPSLGAEEGASRSPVVALASKLKALFGRPAKKKKQPLPHPPPSSSHGVPLGMQPSLQRLPRVSGSSSVTGGAGGVADGGAPPSPHGSVVGGGYHQGSASWQGEGVVRADGFTQQTGSFGSNLQGGHPRPLQLPPSYPGGPASPALPGSYSTGGAARWLPGFDTGPMMRSPVGSAGGSASSRRQSSAGGGGRSPVPRPGVGPLARGAKHWRWECMIGRSDGAWFGLVGGREEVIRIRYD